jgi:hypothetical protein
VISDEEGPQVPCTACGELHPPSLAEKFFIAECERRGLPWQHDVMPGEAQKLATFTSIINAPLGQSLNDKPGLLPYYASALVAISQVADWQAEKKFEELRGNLDDEDITAAEG